MNLGELETPLLLFGGPYGNLQAMQAMVDVAEKLGLPPNRIICTGDIAAYCADPQATTQLIRNWGIHALMGNCEEALGFSSDDCGCGFPEGSVCGVLADQWYTYCRENMDASSLLWMRDLPRSLEFRCGSQSVRVIHGGVSQINRFIFPSLPEQELYDEIELALADVVIAGHSGIPFTRNVAGRIWHNPGAIGMPANDGTANTWYSIATLSREGTLVFEHRRLFYDSRAAAERMQRAGLSEGYARALEAGLWPSMDVLPDAERKSRGVPIESEVLYLNG